LLLAFGELEAGWREPIETAVAALDADRRARRRAAAREMAELIERALGLTVERRVGVDELPQALAEELEQEYRSALERLEADHRRAVQQIYGHHAIAAHPAELEHLERDLFSEGTWLTFGLRRRDLVTVGAAGGAATGGAIDVAVGGASLLVGVAVGAVIGGALGWLGAGRLAELRILDRPLGGRLARYGPSTNLNFPFVLLGRSRFHWLLVAERTHAMRKSLDLARAPADSLPLESGARRALEKSFRVLRRPRLAASARAGALADLTHRIEEILDQDERRDDRAPIAPEGVTSGARP
jgi:hypothetical protein